jgi:hypothetical protein
MYTNPAGDKTFIQVMGPKTSQETQTRESWKSHSEEINRDSLDSEETEQEKLNIED